GGQDLTLYEVDEAATRIREEVDQDANIIVGATFDESLDGIIRVSVVATGIEHVSAKAAPVESRMTELTHKLRSDHQRHAERVERAEHPRAMRPQPQQPMDLDQVAKAAVAAALLPPTAIEDVT